MPRLLRNSLYPTFRFLLSIWIILTVLFALLYILPGDPVSAVLGTSSDAVSRESLRQILGLDRPFLDRYFFFWNKLIRLDWGVSIYTGRPVIESAASRFLVTFGYAIPACLGSIILGYILAISSHLSNSLLFKRLLSSLTLIGSAFPVYFILLLAFWLFKYIVPMPVVFEQIMMIFILCIYPVAFLMHLFLNFLEEEEEKPYILQLKSFRVNKTDLYSKILLKGAVGTILGSLPPLLNIIIGNCFFLEYIFSIPGGCLWTVNAVIHYDYPVVFGATALLAILYLGLNYIIQLFRSLSYGI